MDVEALVPSSARFGLLLGLAFFFGLAFEELNAQGGPWRPGGIRTFPLLALIGGLLYLLDPARLLPFTAGLLVLGGCLAIYYWQHIDEKDAEGRPNVTLALPFCNLLAYVLGPVSLSAPPWIPTGATVVAVLLLTERRQLHRFAWGIAVDEIITAGKFLILTGIVLPLLPDHPVTSLTSLTPQEVWLAITAICTISYAGYLLQRYVVPSGAALLVAALGGLYSTTVTTVVLARRVRTEGAERLQTQIGMILAAAVMYVRLLLIIAFFNLSLALEVAPALLGLSALGFLMAGGLYTVKRPARGTAGAISPPSNPLELGTAATFALLFIAVSVASSWAAARFGSTGIYAIAAIIGVSDINPFILTLAQHGVSNIPDAVAAAAVLLATGSNNLFQALYAVIYSGGRAGLVSPLALVALSLAGVVLAFMRSGISPF